MQNIKEGDRPLTPEERQELFLAYRGVGGVPELFEDDDNKYAPEWLRDARETLRGLLDDEAWEGLRASVVNAHYTDPAVARAMWDLARHLGIDAETFSDRPARVLDPCVGSGVFPAVRPDDVPVSLTAVEKEPLAAAVAARLFPNARVIHSPFEAALLPNGHFDLVISNFPFGKYRIAGVGNKTIHHGFAELSLDKVREGGLVIALTSIYALNSADASHRRDLLKRADLKAAFLLPEGVFDKMAKTQVATALMVLQKRPKNAPAPTPDAAGWIEAKQVVIDGNPYYLNEYFEKHPEHILGGRLAVTRGMYQHGVSIVPDVAELADIDGDLPDQVAALLRRQIPRLEAGIVPKPVDDERQAAAPREKTVVRVDPDEDPLFTGNVPGGYVLAPDGQLQRVDVERNGEIFLSPADDLPKSAARLLRDFLPFRDQVLKVIRIQRKECDDETLERELAVLRERYDDFVAVHGPLNDPALNKKLAKLEPQLYFLQGIETYDPKTGEAEKSEFFFRRTFQTARIPDKVDGPLAAIALSFGIRGRLDFDLIADKLGLENAEAAIDRLVDEDLIFQDPTTLEWMFREQYLSGDIYAKLNVAEAAARHDPAFARNVKALEAAIPAPVPESDVIAGMNIGASWVPEEMVRQFLAEMVGVSPDSDNFQVARLDNGGWTVKLPKYIRGEASEWKIEDRKKTEEIVAAALNGQDIAVDDHIEDASGKVCGRVQNIALTRQAKRLVRQVNERFQEWVAQDSVRKAEIADLYNRKINCYRIADYSSIADAFPVQGITSGRTPRPFQKRVILRALIEKSLLLNHPVGSGKTFEGAAIALMRRRLGIANGRAMMVVPKPVLKQVAAETRLWFPEARVRVVTNEDLKSPRNRERFIGDIIANDYDVIVTTGEMLRKIPLPPRAWENHIRARIEEKQSLVETARQLNLKSSRGFSVKKTQTEILALEAKLKDLKENYERQKMNAVNFDTLGIGTLVVDEAHYYKNLETPSCRTRTLGVPRGGSDRAEHMNVVLAYVREQGGSTYLMTGTPATNTPVPELYVMLRHTMDRETLAALGYSNLDQFLKNFADTGEDYEWRPDGSVRLVERLREVKNVPELRMLMAQVMDTLTEEDKGYIQKPALENHTAVVEKSPLTEAFDAILAARAVRLAEENVDPKQDNILKLMTDGRKMAVSPLLALDPALAARVPPIAGLGKLDDAAARLYDAWQKGRERDSVSLVFLDVGTPKKDGLFSVYGALKQRLIDLGVPAEEIAFVHDAKNDDQREQMFDDVRQGKIRIFFGSTDKMGTGVNIPNKVSAMFHLDIPPTPAQIEQRTGRGHRHGNENPKVDQFFVVMEDSMDLFYLSLNKMKQQIIGQITAHHGTHVGRTIKTDDQPPYDDIIAAATGSETYRRKAEIDRRVQDLQADFDLWVRRRGRARSDVVTGCEIVRRNTTVLEMNAAAAEHAATLRTLRFVSDLLEKRKKEVNALATQMAGWDETAPPAVLEDDKVRLTVAPGPEGVRLRVEGGDDVAFEVPCDPDRGIAGSLFDGYENWTALEAAVREWMNDDKGDYYTKHSFSSHRGAPLCLAGIEVDVDYDYVNDDYRVQVNGPDRSAHRWNFSKTLFNTVSLKLRSLNGVMATIAGDIDRTASKVVESLEVLADGVLVGDDDGSRLAAIREEIAALDKEKLLDVDCLNQIVDRLGEVQFPHEQEMHRLLEEQEAINKKVTEEFRKTIPSVQMAYANAYGKLIDAIREWAMENPEAAARDYPDIEKTCQAIREHARDSLMSLGVEINEEAEAVVLEMPDTESDDDDDLEDKIGSYLAEREEAEAAIAASMR